MLHNHGMLKRCLTAALSAGIVLSLSTSAAAADAAQTAKAVSTRTVTTNGAVITGKITGNVVVSANNITFRDAIVDGEIRIVPESYGGIVTLDGESSANSVVMESEDMKLAVSPRTQVQSITVKAPSASVEIAGSVDSVQVEKNAQNVNISASAWQSVIKKVTVESVSANIYVAGRVEKLTAPAEASGMSLNIVKGGRVSKIDTAADNITIAGTGGAYTVVVTSGKGVVISGDLIMDRIENQGDSTITVGNNALKPGQVIGDDDDDD